MMMMMITSSACPLHPPCCPTPPLAPLNWSCTRDCDHDDDDDDDDDEVDDDDGQRLVMYDDDDDQAD